MPFIQNRAGLKRSQPEDGLLSQNPEVSGLTGSTQAFPSTSHPSPPVQGLPSSSAHEDPLVSAILGTADIASKIFVSHPCTVLRRQCQVHQNARSLHLTPLTLVPVIGTMASREGPTTLWKGAIGTTVVWGLASVTEIVIADLFGLPRNIVPNGSTEKYWRHVVLKALTAFVMTPFYISAFTETVRSVSGLGGDDNKVTDVLVKAVDRMRFAVFGSRDASRRFSILHLAIPTMGYRTAHFIIQDALYNQFFRMAKRYVSKKPESDRTRFHQYVPQIFARTSSMIVTDLILFPLETVIHRLYIQGTRTLIDNMDTGVGAVSTTVKYSGFIDCFRSIVEKEGICVLYAGVGALALDYMFHSLLHQVARAVFDRGSEVLRQATAHHHHTTPPISTNTSFTGPLSGPLAAGPISGGFTPQAQMTSPITPRRSAAAVTSPPKDPTQFPTFGESIAQLEVSSPASGLPPWHSNRPNAFGSPPQSQRERQSPMAPLSLNTDRINDPFSG